MKSVTATEYTGSEFESLLEDTIRRVLESHVSSISSNGQDDLMTVPQAAVFLSLSIPTIYGLLHRKELPAMKRAKRVYFKRSELLQYLEQGKKKTLEEIEREANSFSSGKRRSK